MAVRDLGNIPNNESSISKFRANEIVNRMTGLNTIMSPTQGKLVRTVDTDYQNGQPTNANAIELEGSDATASGIIGYTASEPFIAEPDGDTPVLHVADDNLALTPIGSAATPNRLWLLAMKRIYGRNI